MAAGLIHLLDVLNSVAPPPVSKFLSFCGSLDTQEVRTLAAALQKSTFNGGLRLKGCELNDSGAELIAAALGQNRAMKTLELPDNNIGCKGADAMAGVLQSANFVVTTLDLTGNPCEVYAPQAMEAISACLRRNRLGLCNAPLNTPVKTMGELVTPPTMYHTVQPFDPSSTPESKEGGSARRVLQTIDKENWALSTGKDAGGQAWGPGGLGAIELEYRLQHLESSQNAIGSELDQVKALGSSIEGWKHQMNDAGAQAAAVLALVQSDGSEIRARLCDLDNWKLQVEAASQHFDGVLGGLRGNWYRLEQRFDQIANRLEHKRTPRAIDSSPYQQQVQQVREQCQQQLELLHANVEEVQQAQQAFAASSGLGRGVGDDLDIEARLESLGQDLDDVRGITHRLERYVEQMLRQMLGSLNAGQQRLQVDYQALTDRVVKAEKQHTSFASQLQQNASCQNQLKAALRNAQRQASTVEAGQAKLLQEVTDLGQAVEQVKGRKGPALHWQRSQEQALQKLQLLVAKTESQSSEALRTTQAESARATRAEAVRSAQTEALVDSLLSFQQTQAAELTKRDDAIAELQRNVAKLHIQQQGGSERQLGSADGQSQTTEGQQDGLERQKFTLEGQRFACTAQQDAMLGHSHAGTNPLGCQKAAAGAAKGSCGRNEKAAVGLLKGRTRQSIDGRISRQGPKVAIKTKATASRATSCLPQGGLSTPQRGLSTQTDLQQRRAFSELLENEMASPEHSATPLQGSISAEGMQHLLDASSAALDTGGATLVSHPLSPNAIGSSFSTPARPTTKQVLAAEEVMLGKDVVDRGSQLPSNHTLQETVVQQQADICRLESELAAMQRHFQHMCRDQEEEVATVSSAEVLTHQGSDGAPADSLTSSPAPSPPRQCIDPQQGGRPQASKGGSRLTGSKRALSSRSNQDSARQLMTKQRIGRASAVGLRSSAEGRRLSCAAVADTSRSLDGVVDSGPVVEGSQGEGGRAVPVGQRSKALRQSVDLKQGKTQAVHMTGADSQVEAKAAAARKSGSKKTTLSSLG